ncbi:DUF4350 domain-containing protein [Georgenia sp. AZ-5]|uniref:DUF4350 domain-containing protein n=1 Tax=Georgenia sp. AZ-5 TaxID=3367526 RepID=UPI003754A74C
MSAGPGGPATGTFASPAPAASTPPSPGPAAGTPTASGAPTAPAAPGGPDAPPEGAAGRARVWWRRRRAGVVIVAAFLALALLATALTDRTSARPLAPDNPAPDGARAVAQILTGQGVTVREATTLAQAGRLAGPGSTVLVTDVSLLTTEQRESLLGTGADLVAVGATFDDLDGLGGRVDPGGAGSADPVAARCPDPDATAAGRLSFSRGSVTAEPGSDAVVCFPVDGEGAGAYAVWRSGDQTVRYLADARVMTNEHLADAGNAALALRMLGHHPELVWYLPSPLDTSSANEAVPVVPPRVPLVIAVLAAAVAVLALARGRALGRVVTEVMPVVVRAAETTRGRGRLYRRSRAYDHAAAALRAGTASRVARELGLPRSADAETLLAAVVHATGRRPEDVHALLYGPAPADDAGLLHLSTALDTLESEVHP